jgi:hypothetical protein
MLPENTPAKHRNNINCQIVLLRAKIEVATAMPIKAITMTGFLPNRSAALPQAIIKDICATEKSDS